MFSTAISSPIIEKDSSRSPIIATGIFSICNIMGNFIAVKDNGTSPNISAGILRTGDWGTLTQPRNEIAVMATAVEASALNNCPAACSPSQP